MRRQGRGVKNSTRLWTPGTTLICEQPVRGFGHLVIRTMVSSN